MKRLGLFLAILLVVAVGRLAYRITDRPTLAPFEKLEMSEAAPAPGMLRVTFMGVSTLLFDDGETAILVDGFFSRPGLVRTLARKIAPDRDVIRKCLERAGIKQLAAVIVVHSHYDHAMDAPIVAAETGAVLVGSESTANIARGLGLGDEAMQVIKDGERLSFGKFAVTPIRTQHFPHGMAMGEITAPLVPPVRSLDYLEGGSYSLFFEHTGRSLLVQASAGFVPGALRGRAADVVFLGLTGLSTRDDEYREGYWREVVDAVGAKRVIPVHWDDFTLSLDQPLEAMPSLLDDIPSSIRFLLERGKDRGVEIRMPPTWKLFDPFADIALDR